MNAGTAHSPATQGPDGSEPYVVMLYSCSPQETHGQSHMPTLNSTNIQTGKDPSHVFKGEIHHQDRVHVSPAHSEDRHWAEPPLQLPWYKVSCGAEQSDLLMIGAHRTAIF